MRYLKREFFTLVIMKNIVLIFSLSLVIACFAGCDEGETQQDRTRAFLVAGGAWNIASVVIDGADQTAAFQNMLLSFSPTDFAATNGGVVWPATGAWTFEEGSSRSIVRDDGLVITIASVGEKNLTLGFQWDETEPGMTGYDPQTFLFSFVRL
jgi:hypothetical protein